MNKLWLIIDCNYLCHRAKHSTGGLSHGNTPTGIIYGFLKSIQALQDQFNTKHIIFCWDSKTSKRKDIFPKYKEKRIDRYKDMTKKEIRLEKEFRQQMKLLRIRYLKLIGYNNNFVQPGYEGDDIMASITLNLKMNDEAILVTSDKDMYQLISPKVSFFDPSKGKLFTYQGFMKKYQMPTYDWGSMKCLAGCTTDDVPGVKGVGEITAIKYIRMELKPTTKAYRRIVSKKGLRIEERNRELVVLPFAGVKNFKLRKDELSYPGWKNVMNQLGMKSLKDKGPVRRRK